MASTSAISAVTCGWDNHLRTVVLKSWWSESLEVMSWSTEFSLCEAFYISQTFLVQFPTSLFSKAEPDFVLLNIAQMVRLALPTAFACAVSQDVLEL